MTPDTIVPLRPVTGTLPLYCVHPVSGSVFPYLTLAPLLGQEQPVYGLEAPGYEDDQPPVALLPELSERYVEEISQHAGGQPLCLLGWSMGGAIVQHVAADHPQRVRRLMLFDSAGLFVLPTWDTRLFTPGTPAELDQLDTLLMPHPPNVPGFVARDILRVSNHRAWIIHRALDAMLTGQDATDKLLPQLKMPVLIVWGADDKITPLSLGQTMHRMLPQSELDVVPGCGHLAPGQCAAQMAPEVVAFLKL